MRSEDLAALESRLRALEYGLAKSRGHVVQAKAELQRADELHSSMSRLVKEARAHVTLAQSSTNRRGGAA
jgi:hypothetical protein